jgi:hypothetical protein
MATPSLVLGVPAQVLDLVQTGLIEREFHDGLFPNLAYRAEFEADKWEGNTGTEIVMTRAGLLGDVVTPNTPGADPVPQNVPFEQWTMHLDQYASAIDTDMPTSAVANSNLFLRNIHQLGLQAGRSINRVARNTLFKSYLSGQTVLLASALSGATSLRVAALNGFTDVVLAGTTARPQNVSIAFPLSVNIGTGTAFETKSVIGFVPDNAADPFGPGTLTLSAGLTNNQAVRAPVISAFAPIIVRAGNGASVDAISANDTLSLQQIINACAFLRNANVQPHDDGTYHAHISPLAQAQVYADPVYQRLNQSLPEGMAYSQGFIGQIHGVSFFMNTESPTTLNVGTLVATVAASGSTVSGQYAPELGAEIVNGNGTTIGRVVVTGKGTGYERYLDEGLYVTEAGTTGKIGEFSVVNNGLQILTERIRLVIRAPLDRLQQKVSAAWSITTGFAMPSDITAPSGPQRFKRAVILEFAL